VETIWTFKALATLTFPSDPKINLGHLPVMTNPYMNYGEQKPLLHLWPLWPFWPINPKISRSHLLVMTNQYVKYEDFVIKWAETIVTSMASVILNFDIVPQNQKGSSASYDQSVCEIWRLCDKSFQDNQRKPCGLPTDRKITIEW
jgi:hypothetical protein